MVSGYWAENWMLKASAKNIAKLIEAGASHSVSFHTVTTRTR